MHEGGRSAFGWMSTIWHSHFSLSQHLFPMRQQGGWRPSGQWEVEDRQDVVKWHDLFRRRSFVNFGSPCFACYSPPNSYFSPIIVILSFICISLPPHPSPPSPRILLAEFALCALCSLVSVESVETRIVLHPLASRADRRDGCWATSKGCECCFILKEWLITEPEQRGESGTIRWPD